MIPISVVTPVGPHPHNIRWLPECVMSVENQTVRAWMHVFILDGFEFFKGEEIRHTIFNSIGIDEMKRAINTDTHVGPACVNLGIAAAETDWVVILNSDDYFFPDAIKILTERIEEVLAEHRNRPFWLRFNVNCSDGTRSPGGQCFHKEVWEQSGKYPNTPILDFDLVSRILVEDKYRVFDVLNEAPIYFHRYHAEQMSKTGVM